MNSYLYSNDFLSAIGIFILLTSSIIGSSVKKKADINNDLKKTMYVFPRHFSKAP